jgi:hypothetical protein
LHDPLALPAVPFYASDMTYWRHNRRHRRLSGWVAILAMAAHLFLGAFAGFALAADPDAGPAGDWPFADFVICTADGAQTDLPVGGEAPAHQSGAGDCDACASTCCGSIACGRIAVSAVLRHVPVRSVIDWSLLDCEAVGPAVLTAFTSRAPPFSA